VETCGRVWVRGRETRPQLGPAHNWDPAHNRWLGVRAGRTFDELSSSLSLRAEGSRAETGAQHWGIVA